MKILQFDSKILNINWDQLGLKLINLLWQLLITTLIFYLISHFGKRLINNYLAEKRKNARNKRAKTITTLINSVFQYTVIFFYLFGILSILGIPVGTLLASAGIFSLALGMGAQGFVSDLVNGFFILSEDQFDVGDTVEIDRQIGTVIQLGLRTTRLKAPDGSLIFIPNRQIKMVQNLAHGSLTLNLTLKLAAANDFKKVTALLQQLNLKIKPARGTLLAQPKIIGLTEQNGTTVNFTISFKIKPEQSGYIRNLYLSHYLPALEKQHIKLAQPAKTTEKNN